MIKGCGVIHDGYSSDQVLHRIFTGSSAAEAAETYAELEALGNSANGDRLRALCERLIQLLRDMETGDGSFLWPSGEPMTPLDIAHRIGWDALTIATDLLQLEVVGLLTQAPAWEASDMEGRP